MNKEKGKVKKLKIAVFWSFAAEIAAKLIVPITNIILARILAPEVFGIIATINMIISFADILSTTGISKYLIQHNFKNDEELYQNSNVAFWFNIIVSVLSWILIFLFRFKLSKLVGCPGMEKALTIAALSIPLISLSSIHEALFQRKMDFKTLFYIRIIVSILPFFVTIPLACWGFGYWSLIIGNLVANIVKILIYTYRSLWNPKLYFNFEKLKNMFSFSTWMILGSLTSWLITYVDVLLVSNQMGEYYTGLYKNSQTTVVAIVSIITAATSSVLFSSLSREQDDDKKFEDLFLLFQRKMGIFIVPLGIGMFCFSNLITYILLGKKWMEASSFIGLWGLSTCFNCLFADFCQQAFKIKGKPNIPFIVQIVHLLFLIPICKNSVVKGFSTLCIVRSIANLELSLIYFLIIKKYGKISFIKMLENLKEIFLCSLIMGFFAIFIMKLLPNNYFIQFIEIIFCIIVYFLALFCFKKYRNEFLTLFKESFNKLGVKNDR